MKFTAGIILLLSAFAASLMLVLANFGAMSLPGCGEGSGCGQAAASVWGRIPGLGWPLSFVGTAYFGGLLLTFCLERGRLPEVLRYLVRISVLGSVILVTVMFKNGYLCQYCLAVHGSNLLFWLLIEFLPATRNHLVRPLGALAGCFVVVLGSLILIEFQQREAVLEQAEIDRNESMGEILQADPDQRHAFTGRYHYGPRDAPMHIVMFTDYQCPDCQNIEEQVRRIFGERRERNDISLSIKHFPFSTDCNPKLSRNRHPNACWAARVAETAGILRGDAGFYEMHDWLFQIKGDFTNAQLDAALRRMGYEPREFLTIMQGPEVEQRIKADIAEATSLGLYFTPMIFINGWELRGTATPNILYRTVRELAPQYTQPVYDALPDDARTKYIVDWQARPRSRFNPELVSRTSGPDDARARILVWGDYLEPKTAELDREIRQLTDGRTDVQYTFRHYPVNPQCNPNAPITTHELTCRAHQAVAAAGILGGDEAYWNVHRWLLDHQAEFSDARLREIAPQYGLIPEAWLTTMDSAEVSQAIAEDIDVASTLRLRGIPACYVNEKLVPRLWFEEDCLLDEILSQVLGEDLSN